MQDEHIINSAINHGFKSGRLLYVLPKDKFIHLSIKQINVTVPCAYYILFGTHKLCWEIGVLSCPMLM